MCLPFLKFSDPLPEHTLILYLTLYMYSWRCVFWWFCLHTGMDLWSVIVILNHSDLQIRVRKWKIFFLFLNQSICCGYSKHTFKLICKEIITFLRSIILLNWTYARFLYPHFLLLDMAYDTFLKNVGFWTLVPSKRSSVHKLLIYSSTPLYWINKPTFK